MDLYRGVNYLLLAEYTMMAAISFFTHRPIPNVIYWIGAVILQIGITWGLK